jgi:hypothetical protein
MRPNLPMPLVIVAIVISGVGSSLLTLVFFWMFIRFRKARKCKQELDVKEVNEALDRAIVSYIIKENPSPQDRSMEQPQQDLDPVITGSTETPTTVAREGTINWPLRPSVPPIPPTRLLTPVALPRGIPRRTLSSRVTVDSPRAFHRKTASSPLTDSAERVYASILASPLENTTRNQLPRPIEVVPAARRDDIGWPLTTENWF